MQRRPERVFLLCLVDCCRSGDTAVVGAHWDDGEDVNAVARVESVVVKQ